MYNIETKLLIPDNAELLNFYNFDNVLSILGNFFGSSYKFEFVHDFYDVLCLEISKNKKDLDLHESS